MKTSYIVYLSLYLKGLCVRGSWRPNRTATYWPPLYGHQRGLSRSPGLLSWRPGGPALRWILAFSTTSCLQLVWSPKLKRGSWGPLLLGAGFLYRILSPNSLVSKLTDFLSSSSYIIVQSPTQYLPITGHRNVSLPPSLEWHVWSSSSGNNCHAVHGSLSSGASVCDCTVGF